MARIAGVDLPRDKRVEIGLIYLWSRQKTSQDILAQQGVNPDTRIKDLTEDEVNKIRALIDQEYVVGRRLTRSAINVKRLMEIGCYREYATSKRTSRCVDKRQRQMPGHAKGYKDCRKKEKVRRTAIMAVKRRQKREEEKSRILSEASAYQVEL